MDSVAGWAVEFWDTMVGSFLWLLWKREIQSSSIENEWEEEFCLLFFPPRQKDSQVSRQLRILWRLPTALRRKSKLPSKA